MDGKPTDVDRLCKVDIAIQWVDSFDVAVTSFCQHSAHTIWGHTSGMALSER